MYFYIAFQLRIGLLSGLFPSAFYTKTLHAFLLYPIPAIRSASFFLLILSPWQSKKRSADHELPLVIFSLLDLNILLTSLFSNTLNVRFPLM